MSKKLPERASAEDLRSGKIPLVKPWAKNSVRDLKKALGSPSLNKSVTLEEKFAKIFNSGYCIVFKNVIKRYDDDWHIRIVWEVQSNPGGQTIASCNWYGFSTITECVDDYLNYLEKLKK